MILQTQGERVGGKRKRGFKLATDYYMNRIKVRRYLRREQQR